MHGAHFLAADFYTQCKTVTAQWKEVSGESVAAAVNMPILGEKK